MQTIVLKPLILSAARRNQEQNDPVSPVSERRNLSPYENKLVIVMKDGSGPDPPLFDFNMIIAATNNFSRESELGKGGFGSVYKVLFISSNHFELNLISFKGL